MAPRFSGASSSARRFDGRDSAGELLRGAVPTFTRAAGLPWLEKEDEEESEAEDEEDEDEEAEEAARSGCVPAAARASNADSGEANTASPLA
jgi:hypothetical protein